MKRLFQGLVCVQVQTSPGRIEQNNEQWLDVAQSKEEAIGRWIAAAITKYPGAVIVSVGAEDVTDAARAAIAMLAAPATDAGDVGNA